MTLVLGMAISVAALRHMLPAKAADVLQAKEFRLMQVTSSSLDQSVNFIQDDFVKVDSLQL